MPARPRKITSNASNAGNDGRSFQDAITRTCEAYANAGIARIEKVDPPLRVFGPPHAKKVIFLENPFLDFVGSWMAKGGRAVIIEAKAIDAPTLRLLRKDQNSGGGIKYKQLLNALKWAAAGAAVAFLWHRAGATRLITAKEAEAAFLQGKTSIRWEEAHRVYQGEGFILLDFLGLMEFLP